MLNIILPSLPYSRAIDPMWAAEEAEARSQGYPVCLYDAEQQKLCQPPTAGPTLYRGWMLGDDEYQQLAARTPLLVSPELYLASHRATGWYDAIAPFTPRSVFAAASEAVPLVSNFLKESGLCFVKGLVKSFGSDSVVASLAEFTDLLRKYEIAPSEQLFIREFVTLADQPEARFFAVRGEAFGARGQQLPAALRPVLALLQARWLYTLDVAYTPDGTPLLIEVGDGQVSDTKEWQLSDLYQQVIQRVAQRAVAR